MHLNGFTLVDGIPLLHIKHTPYREAKILLKVAKDSAGKFNVGPGQPRNFTLPSRWHPSILFRYSCNCYQIETKYEKISCVSPKHYQYFLMTPLVMIMTLLAACAVASRRLRVAPVLRTPYGGSQSRQEKRPRASLGKGENPK